MNEAQAALDANLTLLRKHGVKSFTDVAGGGFSVEFFVPASAPMPEVDKATAAKNDPDVCKCGHPQHAHMNGYCVEGCDAKLCEPEKAK